jgi:protein phosphatase
VAVEAATQSFGNGRGELALRLRTAIEQANHAVIDAASEDRSLSGMGTTAVAFACDDTGACVAHVGDSRAYRVRRGKIEQLTQDHSVVAELVRRGALTEEEALIHPRRHEVLRSLGFEPDLRVDVAVAEASPGDVFLLCSDGLTGVVDDAEIASLCTRRRPSEAAKALVEAANARGGPDNVTVQVIKIGK